MTAPRLACADVSPSELESAKPGQLFRIWPLEGGVKPGYKGYKVLYRSTGIDGRPTAVTGAVLFPAGDDGGASRPVVAWAHPTTGVVTRCAPTLLPGLTGTIQGVDRFLDAGYVIAATDYEGLGSAGAHPYLVGDVAARNVIDSVRAVRNLKDARAGHRYVAWGHSQGGHAVLFTGKDAQAYAPELELLGVAAAAPATRLVDLFEADRNTSSGRSLSSMALLSWSRVFAIPTSEFVEPAAEQGFMRLASDCIETLNDFMVESQDESALARNFLKSDPAKSPRVRSIMESNSTGPLPAGMPVFIAQGTADDLVRPDITRSYVDEICKAGAKVRLHMMPGVSHMFAGVEGAEAAYQWMSGLFEGRGAPDNCR